VRQALSGGSRLGADARPFYRNVSQKADACPRPQTCRQSCAARQMHSAVAPPRIALDGCCALIVNYELYESYRKLRLGPGMIDAAPTAFPSVPGGTPTTPAGRLAGDSPGPCVLLHANAICGRAAADCMEAIR
jgi:hypothetical protein